MDSKKKSNLLSDFQIKDFIKELEHSESKRRFKKSKVRTFTVNTKECRGEAEIIRLIIEEKNWRETLYGKSNLAWFGLALTEEELLNASNQLCNRIPCLEVISRKRITGELLKIAFKYFEEEFLIFPPTYLLPEDTSALVHEMKASNMFIVKPTQGCQGDGIFLAQTWSDLEKASVYWGDFVVQKYIHPPMLLYQKKFDLRIYALVTNVEPLCLFLNQEGLARFCTQDYKKPTKSNIRNHYIHLTNYSLNKTSGNFVHTDELFEPNEGSKQTLTSVFEAIKQAGYNVQEIKTQINQAIAKTFAAVQPVLSNLYRNCLRQHKIKQMKCFQIIGVDVMLDKKGKAWVIELNANPSLRTDYEEEVSPGITRSYPSVLDYHVKSQVITDAIEIARMPTEAQLATLQYGSYDKISLEDYCEPETLLFFEKCKKVFEGFAGPRDLTVVSKSRFRRMGRVLCDKKVPGLVMADFDIIYGKVARKFDISNLDFVAFISALEEIIKKSYGTENLHSKTLKVFKLLERNIKN